MNILITAYKQIINTELRKANGKTAMDDEKLLNRPDWDEYFMEIAEVIKKRSTCLRHQDYEIGRASCRERV